MCFNVQTRHWNSTQLCKYSEKYHCRADERHFTPTCCFPSSESGSCVSWILVNTDLPSLEGFRESSGTLLGRASCLFLRTFLFLLRFLRRRLTWSSLNCNPSGKAPSPSRSTSSSAVDGEDSLASEPSEEDTTWLSWSQNTIAPGLCLTILSRSGEQSPGALSDFVTYLHGSSSGPQDRSRNQRRIVAPLAVPIVAPLSCVRADL